VNKELATHSLHPEGTTYQSRLLASLCFVDWMDADLSLLERSARQIVELGDRMDLPESSAAGRYFIGIARYHLNDLSEAESLFSFVVSRRHAANLEISAQSTFALASVHQANGESDKANELVSSFCREMLRIRNMAVLSLATAFQADLALRQGHLARALKWARSFDPEPFEPMYRFQAPQMTLARILVFQEVSDESDHGAAQFLRRLEEYLRRTHNQRFLIEVKALQAILLASRGNEADALSSMGESVSLAQPGGFIRVFVDLGPGISSLLERLDADEEQSRYIERILAAFTESSYNRSMAVAPVRTAGPPGPELVEPLTNREIDILNLLGERLTNNEIADRLNISPATVKRHAENLYGKLGVSSRREAVHQAKHLGILVP
jgi:LuxR family maltose regulon positive regulatory protein